LSGFNRNTTSFESDFRSRFTPSFTRQWKKRLNKPYAAPDGTKTAPLDIFLLKFALGESSNLLKFVCRRTISRQRLASVCRKMHFVHDFGRNICKNPLEEWKIFPRGTYELRGCLAKMTSIFEEKPDAKGDGSPVADWLHADRGSGTQRQLP
jgi:hypothetical protein